MSIRKAKQEDLSRIGEIYVFNNRMNYLPIFKDENYSFNQLQVVSVIKDYFQKKEILKTIYVLDDEIVRGFIQIKHKEICKLYVDPFFQGKGYGHQLMEFALNTFHVDHLWAIEKNVRAIAFYKKHGFDITNHKKLEEGTSEYLIELKRKD